GRSRRSPGRARSAARRAGARERDRRPAVYPDRAEGPRAAATADGAEMSWNDLTRTPTPKTDSLAGLVVVGAVGVDILWPRRVDRLTRANFDRIQIGMIRAEGALDR